MKKIYQKFLYLILALNLGVIFYFWWQGSYILMDNFADVMLALGQITGLLAGFFALMQIVLIGRAPWLERTFGQDKLANIHRLNGYLTIIMIILHPIFLTIGDSLGEKIGFWDQIVEFWQNEPGVNFAIVAAFIFIAIVFLSIYIVRSKMRYETWYYIHLLTYLAIALAFGHQLQVGTHLITSKIFLYYWLFLYVFSLGNLLVFHFLAPYFNFIRFGFVVEKLVQETNDTWSVYISGKNLQNWHAKAGQFISVRFLAKHFWWQAHPFSLSAVPNKNYLRLTIKCCGDFTKQIPQLKAGTKVIVGGPYGVFTALKAKATKYLFIAGGVGITPIRSVIETVAPDSNVILIYSNRDLGNVIFKDELNKLSTAFNFPINYLFTNESPGVPASGRLDGAMLARMVTDLKDREIYLCGPKPMTDALIKAMLENLGVKKSQLHFEKFSF